MTPDFEFLFIIFLLFIFYFFQPLPLPIIFYEQPNPPNGHFWPTFRVAVDSRLYCSVSHIPW